MDKFCSVTENGVRCNTPQDGLYAVLMDMNMLFETKLKTIDKAVEGGDGSRSQVSGNITCMFHRFLLVG